jgi:hypothetical protein
MPVVEEVVMARGEIATRRAAGARILVALVVSTALACTAVACGGRNGPNDAEAGNPERPAADGVPETTAATGPDGLWVAAEIAPVDRVEDQQTTIISSSDGVDWQTVSVIPHESVRSLAWGDGRWIAVTTVLERALPMGADPPPAEGHVLESSDLISWKTVAALPTDLQGVAFGEGYWIAVGAAGGAPFERYLPGRIYRSTDGVTWTDVETETGWIKTDSDRGFTGVAYGDGRWIAIAGAEDATRVKICSWEFSTDGITWKQDNGGQQGGFMCRVAFGDGQSVLAQGDDASSGLIGRVGLNHHGVPGWSSENETTLPVVVAIAYGAGTWMLAAGDRIDESGANVAPSAAFYTSTDLETWSPVGHVDAIVEALAFRGNHDTSPDTDRSTSTSTSTVTGTGTSARSAPSSNASGTSGDPCSLGDPSGQPDPAWSRVVEVLGPVHLIQACDGAFAIVTFDRVGELLLALDGGVWKQADAAGYCANLSEPVPSSPPGEEDQTGRIAYTLCRP